MNPIVHGHLWQLHNSWQGTLLPQSTAVKLLLKLVCACCSCNTYT